MRLSQLDPVKIVGKKLSNYFTPTSNRGLEPLYKKKLLVYSQLFVQRHLQGLYYKYFAYIL